MPKTVHDIVWDKERISAFWNFLGFDQTMEPLYFSRQKGKSVLKYVARQIDVKGKVVDLGCGPGFFIDQLLAAGIACEGVDLSPDSITKLKERLRGNPHFRGGKVSASLTDVPYTPGSVDVIFFFEALEHLLPEDRREYLENISTALAPGGYLVATVPYEENLEREKVICPSCGCRFHRVQHMTSYSTDSLRRLMEQHPLHTLVCKPKIFLPDWQVYTAAKKVEVMRKKHFCPECREGFETSENIHKGRAGVARLRKIFNLTYIGQKMPLL